MALDAGSVYTLLGGRFSPRAFAEYDAANKKAIASATSAEARMKAAATSGAHAQDRMTASALRGAAANEAVATSTGRVREQLDRLAHTPSIDLRVSDTVAKAKVQTFSAEIGELHRKIEMGMRIGDVEGVGRDIAQLKLLQAEADATREKIREATAGGGGRGIFSRVGGGLPGGLPLPLAAAPALAPIGLGLAGGAAAVAGSAGAGLLGAGALGVGGLGILAAGLGSVVAVAKPAFAAIGDVTKAQEALTTAQEKYGPASKQAAKAQEALNNVLKGAPPGVAAVAKGLEGLKRSWQGLSAPAQGVFFAVLARGLEALRTLLPTVAGVAKTSLEAIRAGLEPVFKALESPAFHAAVVELGNAFAHLAPPLIAGFANIFHSLMLVAVAAAPYVVALAQDFQKLTQGWLAGAENGGKLRDVISHLVAQTKTWAGLATSLGKLLFTVFSGGASQGQAMVTALTNILNRWNAWLKTTAGQEGLRKFFSDSRVLVEALFSAIGRLGPILAQMLQATAGLMPIVTQGFHVLASVISAVVSVITTVTGALGGARVAGDALGAALTVLAAAWAIGKIAAFVSALGTVAGAIRGIAVAAAGADLAVLLSPLGLIAGAAVLAVGAFVAFKSGLFDSASAADKAAAALQKDKEAIDALHHSTEDAAKAEIAGARAKLQHKEAAEHLKQVEKEVHDGTLKGTAAQNALLSAHLGVAESAQAVTAARKTSLGELNKEIAATEKAAAATSARSAGTFKEIQDISALIARLKARGAGEAQMAAAKEKLIGLEAKYNAESRKQIQANAEIAVSEESRIRIKRGLNAITAQNAQGVQQLQNALFEAGAPKKIVTRFELEDQGAQAKLGALAAQLNALGRQQVVAKVLTTAPSAAVAIQAFKAILHGVPASKVVSILHNAPSAKAAMNSLTGAIHAVPPSKGVTIATNAGQATAAINSVGAAVNGLVSFKSITIAVNTVKTTLENVVKSTGKHASGRQRGPAEPALVGEGGAPEYVIDASGRGMIVQQPTLMGLAPEDYVIPLEERFRGRALGLFAMLARDLEIPGFKAGRGRSFGSPGGKKEHHPGKHWPIPNAIPPLSLPVEEIKIKQEAAKSAQDKAKSKVKTDETHVHSLEGQLHKAKGARAAKLRSELAKAKKQAQADARTLAHDKRDLAHWTRTLHEAEAFQGQIKHVEAEASNAGNAMKLAAGRDDRGAYDAARAKRLGALAHLQALIKQAQAQVKTGTDYALKLEGEVQQAELDTQGTTGEAFQPTKTKAEEEEERTGETEAERAEQKHIEASIALAALTPDLADDKARAAELVSFLSKVLGEVQAEPAQRGGDESIIAIANALKTAQSNVASFAGGSASNENADLQAQITQEKARREVAERGQQTAEGALAVFGGSGDIGAGGSNAAGATVNVYTLHPGDPQTLSAIGAAATAGIGLQGYRQAPRIQAGP